MKKLTTIIVSVCLFQHSFSQCPNALFSLPDTGCAGVALPLINNSTGNGLSYNWDFCPNELKGGYTTNTHGVNGFNFNGLTDFKLIKANGNYYFFEFDTIVATQALIRCDVGSNLYNQTPNANYYFLTPFNKADHFDFIEDNNIWYGFATYSPTNTLFLMTFGAGITAQPTTSAITGIANVNIPSSVKLLKSNGIYYAFITNKGDNSITCISFGNAMTNPATQVYNYVVPGATGLSDIDITLTCNPVTGFVTSENTGDIIKLNFGNDVAVPPTASIVGSFGSVGNGKVVLGQEGSNSYLFFTDLTTQTIRQLSFPNDYSTTPTASTFSNFFNTLKDIQFLKDSSRVRLVAGDFAFNYFSEVVFLDSCGGNNFSNLQSPIHTYNSTGWHYLTLTVTDSLGFTSVHSDSIYLVAGPTANFSYSNNLCFNLNDSISFTDLSTSPSGSITSWQWDFDDSSPVSTVQNPFHTFTAPGTYNVHLTIVAGCNKDTIIPITIKETPAVGFTYVPQCAGTLVPFTDTTVLNSSTIQTWQWNFGDTTATSSSQNPSHNFILGGTYNVQLIVQSAQGCTDSVSLLVVVNSTPQAAFSVLNTCVGDTVLFQNQTTINNGGSINYIWDFGDGSPTTTITNPSHPYTLVNTYSVVLIASSGSCSDTLIQAVAITTPPTPAFSFPLSNCQNNPVHFTDSSQGVNISSWVWDFGDGDSAFVQNPVHIFTSGGQFTVTLIVSAGNNCVASISHTVQVIQSPNAAFTNNNVCDGLPVSFMDISTAGPITGWVWDFGDGDSSFVQNTLHTYSSPGAYTAVLLVTNSLGCTDTASQQVAVFDLPVVGFQITQIICSGSPVTFNDTSFVLNDVITNWYWDFGDGGTDSVQTPDHTFSAGGLQTVTLTATSSNGCSTTSQQNVSVNQSPQFNFSATNFCQGDSTKFTYTVTGVSSAFSWTWNFGDGGGAFTTNASHVYATADTFNVSLIVIDSAGCSSVFFNTITINAKPNAAFITNGICEQAPVTFINSTSSANVVTSWLWDFGDLQTSIDTMPAHVYADSGNYYITLIAYAQGGCNDTAAASMIIKPKPALSFTQNPAIGSINVPVSFTNTSTGASQYTWSFGDNTGTSILTNPLHTYQDTGRYSVTLIGQSTFGCRDTIVHYYDVLLPYIDLVMEDITYSISDNFLSLNSLIANEGNVPALNYILEADIGTGNIIQETSYDTINLLSQKNYQVNTKFHVSNITPPSYACITIKKVNGGPDAILTNNSKCIALTTDFTMVEITPNPSNGNIHVLYTLPGDGDVKILLYDSRGRQVKELLSQTERKGLSDHSFDLSSIARGVYFVKVFYNNSTRNVRFIKM